jgi:large subunit ribosomal protein L22
MRTHATARFVRVSARKAGLVLEQIRGKPVGDALAILEYTPRAAARLVEKVLRSAVANAEHNHQVRNLDDLWVIEAVANVGPSLKRVQPRAMGRAFFIRHRTSHLTVAVTDERGADARGVNGARRPEAPRARPETARGTSPAVARGTRPPAASAPPRRRRAARAPRAAAEGAETTPKARRPKTAKGERERSRGSQ